MVGLPPETSFLRFLRGQSGGVQPALGVGKAQPVFFPPVAPFSLMPAMGRAGSFLRTKWDDYTPRNSRPGRPCKGGRAGNLFVSAFHIMIFANKSKNRNADWQKRQMAQAVFSIFNKLAYIHLTIDEECDKITLGICARFFSEASLANTQNDKESHS